MSELKEKFDDNFKKWASLSDQKIDVVFLYLQIISLIGQILRERTSSNHRKECCQIFDELFSDSVSSIYLSSCAIDKPALVILRRVLELGVAVIYLWDMPHLAYSWREEGRDLSFSEMLKHINSVGYLSFVEDENSISIDDEIFPASKCQEIYGDLSDIVHGKINSFESSLPERYSFVEKEWNEFVDLTLEVLKILVQGYLLRFPIVKTIKKRLPPAKKILD